MGKGAIFGHWRRVQTSTKRMKVVHRGAAKSTVEQPRRSNQWPYPAATMFAWTAASVVSETYPCTMQPSKNVPRAPSESWIGREGA